MGVSAAAAACAVRRGRWGRDGTRVAVCALYEVGVLV